MIYFSTSEGLYWYWLNCLYTLKSNFVSLFLHWFSHLLPVSQDFHHFFPSFMSWYKWFIVGINEPPSDRYDCGEKNLRDVFKIPLSTWFWDFFFFFFLTWTQDRLSLKCLEDLATTDQQSFMVTGCKFYKTQVWQVHSHTHQLLLAHFPGPTPCHHPVGICACESYHHKSLSIAARY